MKKPKQTQLFPKDLRYFGGVLLLSKRKSKRPFSSKESMHIVLKSSYARGVNSFLRSQNKKPIERILLAVASKYAVKIYQKAIVGNHLHLVIRAHKRKNYDTFIRVISGKIASHVMKQQSFRDFKATLNLERGDPPAEPQGNEQQFWQMRPFSRVLYWGRDFKTCCGYVRQNILEALGFLQFGARKLDPVARHLERPSGALNAMPMETVSNI